MFGRPKSVTGQLARALSISLYPSHLDTLRQRERELNVPCSILIQLLLEVEQRDALLRRELINRLTEIKPVRLPEPHPATSKEP